MAQSSALLLFSGGQDSSVCLAWALQRYALVETVGFAYGQRHDIELDCRQAVLRELQTILPQLAEKLGADHLLALPTLGRISKTSLTRDMAFEMDKADLPNTFVPGRNLLFFTYAAALGYRRDIATLIGGMCETDYSGYPDCRNETLQTLAKAISLGLDREVRIETPLMQIDKAGTWQMAERIGGPALIDLIVEHSHSCYSGNRERRFDWGYGCGTCPACDLRAKGWMKWQSMKTS